MSQNFNPNQPDHVKPSGLSKHVYSTNPDQIVDENLYAHDHTSKNKDLSYQTLENKTIATGTTERVNPFNVKGVPGCKSCGGSGWKESAKHPHPCNECAKKTCPVIDTYLTKVGQTSTPVADTVTIPKTIQVTEYQERVKEVPVTHEVEQVRTVPVTKQVPVTEYIPQKVTVPVTRNVEVTKTVEVHKNVPYTENVEVTERVPETTYKEITKTVPVTKTKQVTENVAMHTTVPVTQNVEITKNVPVTKTKQVTENVPMHAHVPVTENVTITKTVPQTKYVNVVENAPMTTTVTHSGPIVGQASEFRVGAGESAGMGYNSTAGMSGTTTYGMGTTTKTQFSSSGFRGIAGCKFCGGEGFKRCKHGKNKMKACNECVKMTGICPDCNNTGRRLDKDKNCHCMFSKADN